MASLAGGQGAVPEGEATGRRWYNLAPRPQLCIVAKLRPFSFRTAK